MVNGYGLGSPLADGVDVSPVSLLDASVPQSDPASSCVSRVIEVSLGPVMTLLVVVLVFLSSVLFGALVYFLLWCLLLTCYLCICLSCWTLLCSIPRVWSALHHMFFAGWLLLYPDVKDVGYVIVSCTIIFFSDSNPGFLAQNYDFPNNCEDYIHRIGRTGVCHSISVWYYRLTPPYSSVRAWRVPRTLTLRQKTPSLLASWLVFLGKPKPIFHLSLKKWQWLAEAAEEVGLPSSWLLSILINAIRSIQQLARPWW